MSFNPWNVWLCFIKTLQNSHSLYEKKEQNKNDFAHLQLQDLQLDYHKKVQINLM